MAKILKDLYDSIGQYGITALVSAIVSLTTLFITIFFKNPIEKKMIIFKLKKEYEYEQRKKICNTIAKYKIHLLNSSEQLDHRIWDLNINYSTTWNLDLNFTSENYYSTTIIYRILRLLAWSKIAYDELIYLDTTVANKKDLFFLKFIRVFPKFFNDSQLFITHELRDKTNQLYTNILEEIYSSLIIENNVKTYSQFSMEFSSNRFFYKEIENYFKGISPNNKNLNWDALQCFHYTIIAFQNSYGYDYQFTSKKKFIELLKINNQRCRVLNGYKYILKREALFNEKSIRKLIKIIENERIFKF